MKIKSFFNFFLIFSKAIKKSFHVLCLHKFLKSQLEVFVLNFFKNMFLYYIKTIKKIFLFVQKNTKVKRIKKPFNLEWLFNIKN